MTAANHSGDAANMVGQPLTDEQIESLAIHGNDADGLMQAADLVGAVTSSNSKGQALAAILKYRKEGRVDAIQRTLSAVRAQVDGWLPIESAPHGRIDFLVVLANGSQYIEVGDYVHRLIHDAKAKGRACCYTHWRHFPPPPNAQGAAK